MNFNQFIEEALKEDTLDPNGIIPRGDHSAMACIPVDSIKKAHLKIKQEGIIAGIEIAENIFKIIDPNITFQSFKKDGELVHYGEIAFEVQGCARNILLAERTVLNIMQRMSGIATKTNQYTRLINHTSTKLLDTRKTTPNFRFFEKLAVKIGGGHNHRFGLYDMVMLKDNHVDYCGSITKAILQTNEYLKTNNLDLKIEIETRNLKEVEEVLAIGNVHRIMLDNFEVANCKKAVEIISKRFETEASGGIMKETIVAYAETGVDYISVGGLTYSYESLDLSLKSFE
jgi:nicotinate-nucleotide pyrophosphorylase (carboxylating)